MALPVSIHPFLEPEAEPHRASWWRRVPAAAAPAMIAIAVALWDNVAPRGAFGLEVLGLLGGMGLVLAVGAWLERSERRMSTSQADPQPRLPVFLRFDGRRVLVVGGGPTAAAKIPALLAAGAEVTVVAPSVATAIDRAQVHVVERGFAPTDLDGVWFVTAAATPEVNRAVRDAADARNIFVNAVDDSANATAYLGGTLTRSGVTVSFSTSGRAPALAGLLREAFDELIPHDIERWAERAQALSREQRACGVAMAERRPQLLDALNRLYDRRRAAGASR